MPTLWRASRRAQPRDHGMDDKINLVDASKVCLDDLDCRKLAFADAASEFGRVQVHEAVHDRWIVAERSPSSPRLHVSGPDDDATAPICVCSAL
jgi:hypothetical protein